MEDVIRIPAANQLRDVAEEVRDGKLFPINTYKPVSSEYSASHPNALSDGDEKGKGETLSIGSYTDILTRSALQAGNQFNENRPYVYPE